eukprot:TRINITY_DN31663_c0_g1_i1.p1 TRINITY_DN31663_c0_g1~~TRINITY_DN31663_c0_g1_i1.p1  ORF type:complete len:364 (-),score=120.46 TRINITY_DN31663_c0_g1_i1:1768-2859(-)
MAEILVLGGCGMVGRNFVQYIVENKLASFIRVADKTMPMMAFMNEEHKAVFDNSCVEYVQADLSRDDMVVKAFEGHKFDYVFNLAAETRFGQEEGVYKEKILDVAEKCGMAALEHGVKKFVEISTGQIYKPTSKGAATESSGVDPWTTQAEYMYKAEEALRYMDGLPLVVLRPVTVYGPGDHNGLMPRIVCGACYKKLDEKLKFMWDKGLYLNTVHVIDVCRAMWHAATELEAGSVFNIADKGETTQGLISSHLGSIFGIKTGFVGNMLSRAATLKLKSVAASANDKHLEPWGELKKEFNIRRTPLTPFIDAELLRNKSLNIDGSAIEATGFEYSFARLAEESIRIVIRSAMDQGIFPRICEI